MFRCKYIIWNNHRNQGVKLEGALCGNGRGGYRKYEVKSRITWRGFQLRRKRLHQLIEIQALKEFILELFD